MHVPPQRCYCCDRLPSSGITRLHWYYAIIRLPTGYLPSSLYYHLSGILSLLKDPAGYPGLPHIPNVQHAMLSDPEEAEEHLPFALPCVDFRHVQLRRPSHFVLTRLNHFSLRLRPVVLIALCLTFGITPAGPGSSIQWLACLTGAGFTPAGICDLARPH